MLIKAGCRENDQKAVGLAPQLPLPAGLVAKALVCLLTLPGSRDIIPSKI